METREESKRDFHGHEFQQQKTRSVACFSAAKDEPAPVAETKAGGNNVVLLGSLFGLWYFFNIFFNIYNKQVLKVFAFPITCTQVQFGMGVLMASTMWLTKLHKFPKLNKDLLLSVAPLALVHMLGNLLTNVSLGKVAVSFTHTIKAMEPFFSVLLSSMFLGAKPELPVVLSLLPIVLGVSLASFSEASFNWMGFGAAMGSNVTFQSRNVLSKKLMGGKKDALDNINLFSVITIMAFVFMLPVTFITEGIKFTPATMSGLGLNAGDIMKKACFAGLMFHSYQQVSYMILQRVTPVTHSVGNCVKRVVVIVASVIAFRNPVSVVNAVGTGVALSGVFLYSQVKRLTGKKD